jgi:5'-nucleotidase
MILNVNVPDLPYERLSGFRATARPSASLRGLVRSEDPRPARLLGRAGRRRRDAGEGTDFDAVANGYVSVTPLQVDLTRHHALNDVADWLSGRPA